MNYDGGNRVTMHRLSGETEEDFSGVYSGYNTDDIKAVKVIPAAPKPVLDEETRAAEGGRKRKSGIHRAI